MDWSVLRYMSVRRSIFEIAACFVPRSLARCSCVIWRAARNSSRGICSVYFWARTRAFSWASGDIFLRSSRKFFATFLFPWFLFVSFDLLQVIVKQLIGNRHIFLVPFGLARLVSADEQNCISTRIESV